MGEIKTRKVRRPTTLGKISKSIPILPLYAYGLSRIIVNPEKFTDSSGLSRIENLGPGLVLANIIFLPLILEDAYTESKKQFWGYSKKLSGLEELALWTTAFSVLRNEAPDVYQTFSGTSFDQAYGRQR